MLAMIRRWAWAVLALTMVFCSCHRRPLVRLNTAHYVKIYIDEQILNVTTGHYDYERTKALVDYTPPAVFRVLLGDIDTGKVQVETFLRTRGSDENGDYYDGYISAPAGRYILLAYNFGTETTLLGQGDNIYNMYAYTNRVGASGNISTRSDAAAMPLVYMPDFLFVAAEEVELPWVPSEVSILNRNGKDIVAHNQVETYYIEIGLTGAEYVGEVAATLSGMSESKLLWEALKSMNPVTIQFPMPFLSRPDGEGGEILYGVFHTFGDLTPNIDAQIKFLVTTKDGRRLVATIDLTDEFFTPEARENQWLLLKMVLDVPAPEPADDSGGGFSPTVTDWESVEQDLVI